MMSRCCKALRMPIAPVIVFSTLLLIATTRLHAAWVQCPATNREMRVVSSLSDWFSAELACQAYGGHLATLRAPSDRNCAARSVASAPECGAAATCGSVWVGLNNLNHGPDWHWPGENNALQVVTGGEQGGDPDTKQCVNWNVESGFRGSNCTQQHYFICERREPVSSSRVRVECDGQRWEYHTVGFSPEQAEEACRADGSRLAPQRKTCINVLFQLPQLKDARELLVMVSCGEFGQPGKQCVVYPSLAIQLLILDVSLGKATPFICVGNRTDPTVKPSTFPPLPTTTPVTVNFTDTPLEANGTTSEPATESDGGGSSAVAGVLGFLGGTALVVLVAAVLFVLWRRRSRIACRKSCLNALYTSTEQGGGESEEGNSSPRSSSSSEDMAAPQIKAPPPPSSLSAPARCFPVAYHSTSLPRTWESAAAAGQARFKQNSLPYAISPPIQCLPIQCLRGRSKTQPYRVRTVVISDVAVFPSLPRLPACHEYVEPLQRNPAYGCQHQSQSPQTEEVQYSYDVMKDET